MPNWKFLFFIGGIIGGVYYSLKALFQFILAIVYFVTGFREKQIESNEIKKHKIIKLTNNGEGATKDTANITNNTESSTSDTITITITNKK